MSAQFYRVGEKLVPVDSTTARLHAAGYGHRRCEHRNAPGRDIFRLDTGEIVATNLSAKAANEWLAGLLTKGAA